MIRDLSRATSSRPLRSPSARTATRTGTRTQTANGEDAYIAAIIENTVNEIGISAYNLNGFDVELRQFTDTNTLSGAITTLCILSPVEIVMSVSSAGAFLDQAIQACPYLINTKRTFIGRPYFNETYGALAVEKLSTIKCPNLSNLGESSCYLALACCGALIRYLEHVEELSFTPDILRIRFQPKDHTVFLDIPTLEGLELLANARATAGLTSGKHRDSLLRVMDRTSTRAGKRFMRRALLEPCADVATIAMRQDAVEELANSETIYFALLAVLKRFPDLERAVSSLMNRENARLRTIGLTRKVNNNDSEQSDEGSLDSKQEDEEKIESLLPNTTGSAFPPSITLIQNVLCIKASLESIDKFLQALQGTSSELLKAVSESMRNPSLECLLQEIGKVIDQDAAPAKEAEKMRLQGAFAIKAGRNGQLDICRKTLSDNVEDMRILTEELREKYGIHKLQLSMLVKRGYHLSIQRKFLDIIDFPEEFTQIDEGKTHRFTTVDLLQLNARYEDSLKEVWEQTEMELGSLLNEIFDVKVLTALHRFCDSIAILDTLTSFLTYSSLCQAPTERPRLSEGGPIALKEAHHPILLETKATVSVPNDIFLDETSALHIISGRNQAGKSTFIRMVGLLTVMAHTGCPVPAKFASVRLLRRIATRLSTCDDISQSQSHFSKEMHEVATIVESVRESGRSAEDSGTNANRTSGGNSNGGSTLVLIDELGRATSTVDGFSIAYAVAEYLASCPNVLTLFTTHFLGLGAMSRVNPTISDFRLNTVSQTMVGDEGIVRDDEGEPSTKFTYKVTSGILTDSNYGIDTAKLAGFPDAVIADAQEVKKEIPVRTITHAEDFAKTCFQLDQSRNDERRKWFSVVSVAHQISLITSSTENNRERHKLLAEYQSKVKASHLRNKSRGEGSRKTASRAKAGDMSTTAIETLEMTRKGSHSSPRVSTPCQMNKSCSDQQ